MVTYLITAVDTINQSEEAGTSSEERREGFAGIFTDNTRGESAPSINISTRNKIFERNNANIKTNMAHFISSFAYKYLDQNIGGGGSGGDVGDDEIIFN